MCSVSLGHPVSPFLPPSLSRVYNVSLLGVQVNGRQLDISPSAFLPVGAIIDSGSTAISVPEEVHSYFRSEVRTAGSRGACSMGMPMQAVIGQS